MSQLRRFLLRRKKNYFIALVLVILVLFWLNIELKHVNTPYGDCMFPCFGSNCEYCKTAAYERKPIKVVNIFDHLKLKQALRRLPTKNSSQNAVSDGEQICKRPSFDLTHDSVKSLFFSMTSLNCSKEELFYIESGVFKLNQTVLNRRNLSYCLYYGIERESDHFSTYTEALRREKNGPFDIRIKHDFVRIKCYLESKESKDDKDFEIGKLIEEGSKEEKNIEELVKRRLLQLPSEPLFNNKFNVNKSNHSKLHDSNNKEHTKSDKNIPDVDNKLTDQREQKQDLVNDPSKDTVLKFVPKDNLKPSIPQKRKLNNIAVEYKDDLAALNAMNDKFDYMNQDRYDYYNGQTADSDFDQLLVQVYPKSEVFERIDAINSKLRQEVKDQRMNVLMIGLDSLSHLSYQRKLPKTYKYLKEVLGSVILDGYNIVGDATTAALIPMLTGKTELELPEVRNSLFEADYVDVYPLIWKDFRDKGYVTLFGEDEPTIGVFNLRLNGFLQQPTDHYMRPFWQELWNSEVHKSSPRYCTGNKPNHAYLLDYMKDYFIQYKNVSKFGFVFGSELSHWDNNPIEYMDQDFVDFLTFMNSKGHLDNTVLIVFADHGARYSRIRHTVQGKMEERLPMMSLRFPKWFQQKFPNLQKNLIHNSNRLATPFDIYETLRDVIDLKRTESPIKNMKSKLPRGISLLQQIPVNRTCSLAGIEMHWCTCLKQLELDASDKHVQRSANAIVKYINGITQAMRDKCAALRVKSINQAYLLIPNEMVLMFQRSKDDDNRIGNFSENINIDHAHFQITMETAPNRGWFEGTVQVNMTADSYTVVSTLSRIDMYGDQPRCVQDKYPDLRKYCYCTEKGNNSDG